MDSIELALREYRRLASAIDRAPTMKQSDALENWLSASVCRVAEEIFELNSFRRLADWPLQAFAYGADTMPRRLVAATDAKLVEFAAALRRVAERPAVKASLMELELRWPATSNAWGTRLPVGRAESPDISAAAMIARRAWADLAAPEEYFYPCRQLYALEDESRLAQFDPLSGSKLPPLGDYVTRSMFLRIEHWRALLDRLYGQCVFALTGDENARLLDELVSARSALDGAIQELTAVCLADDEFRMRENVIALVHVYNAYAAAPKLAWLSLSGDILAASRTLTRLTMRRELFDMEAIERVVGALSGVAVMYRAAGDDEDKLAKAVAEQLLVLVDSPRRAFWKSQRIEANWDRKPMLWELLWELASRAQRGLAVDRDNLSNRKSQRAIRDRRSDLGGLLPPALNERIVNAGRYTYRLELPTQDISLFVHEDEGRWTEDGGAASDSKLSAESRSHS